MSGLSSRDALEAPACAVRTRHERGVPSPRPCRKRYAVSYQPESALFALPHCGLPHGVHVESGGLVGIRHTGLLDGTGVVGRRDIRIRCVGSTAAARTTGARLVASTIGSAAARLATAAATVTHTKQRSQAAAAGTRREKSETKRECCKPLHDRAFRERGVSCRWEIRSGSGSSECLFRNREQDRESGTSSEVRD